MGGRLATAIVCRPLLPQIPGLAGLPYFTNETIFANRTLPRHLIVIGGGAVGVELAQAHRRLGAEVTGIDAGPPPPRADPGLVALPPMRLAAGRVAPHPPSPIPPIPTPRA